MENRAATFVMISEEEWLQIKKILSVILEKLSQIPQQQRPYESIGSGYLTALEFMAAVKIKRTKFDQLVQQNKIKIIKKKRKIYVRSAEVERYFCDNMIR